MSLTALFQLHCLQMFRNDMRELMARVDGRSDGKDNTLYYFDSEHTLHCLDYLRQVRTMCLSIQPRTDS